MSGKRNQTCPACSAPMVRVYTIPADIRRFFSLRQKVACSQCIAGYRGRKRQVWGKSVRLDQEAA